MHEDSLAHTSPSPTAFQPSASPPLASLPSMIQSQPADPNSVMNNSVNNVKKSPKRPYTTLTASTSTSNKRSKKMSSKESTIIVEAFTYHKGNWRNIMSDERVKSLNRQEKNLKNHIEYLKTKKNKQLQPTSGINLRSDIVQNIAQQRGQFDDSEEQIDEFEYSANGPEQNNGTTHSPSLSPRIQDLHNFDEEQFDETIASNQFAVADDFNQAVDSIRSNQAIRNNRIKQRDKQHREVINDIREQKEDRKQRDDLQNIVMMTILNIQQQQQRIQQQELEIEQQQQREEREHRQMQSMIMMNFMKILGQSKEELRDKLPE